MLNSVVMCFNKITGAIHRVLPRPILMQDYSLFPSTCSSIDDSLVDALQHKRLLLVWLHSELHRDSVECFKQLGARPEILQWMTTSFTLYGVSTFSEEAGNLAHGSPTTCTYPCVVALLPAGGLSGGVTYVAKLEGAFNPDDLLRFLQQCIAKYKPQQ